MNQDTLDTSQIQINSEVKANTDLSQLSGTQVIALVGVDARGVKGSELAESMNSDTIILCLSLIHIFVPAYRTPEVFLRQMIESLEQQSYPNWELVIGNASPEDETMARVLKEYTEKDTRCLLYTSWA